MPLFPQQGRLDELRRLGLSEPVVRLAAGEDPVWAFLSPPQLAYGHWPGSLRFTADGPAFVPLWSYDRLWFAEGADGLWEVWGVREVGGSLEFVVACEDPSVEVRPIARTEQGLLARLFFELLHDFECAGAYPEDLSRLCEDAEAVGYLHVAAWVETYHRRGWGDHEGYQRLCDDFVARVEALKTSRDRRTG